MLLLRGTEAMISPCLVWAAVALLCTAAGFTQVAPLFACGTIVVFYLRARRTYDHVQWRGNPAHIMCLLLVPSQMLFWLWSITLPYRHSMNRIWFAEQEFPISDVGSACTYYLLSHLIFLVALNFGYRQSAKGRAPVKAQCHAFRAGLFATVTVACSLAYASVWLAGQSQPPALRYVGTFLLRLFPLAVALAAYTIIVSRRALPRLALGALLAVSVIWAVSISRSSGMRFVALGQLCVIVCVFALAAKMTARSIILVSSVLLLGFVLTTSLSVLKFGVKDSGTPRQRALFGLDSTIQRMGAFLTDVELADPGLRRIVTDDPRGTWWRILGGLPFAAAVLPQSGADTTTIYTELYRAYSGNWRINCSSALSALTEIRLAYGVVTMLLAAVAFGYLHGWVSAFCWKIAGAFQWLAVVSVYAVPSIVGIQANDVLDMPLSMLILSVVIMALTECSALGGWDPLRVCQRSKGALLRCE